MGISESWYLLGLDGCVQLIHKGQVRFISLRTSHYDTLCLSHVVAVYPCIVL